MTTRAPAVLTNYATLDKLTRFVIQFKVWFFAPLFFYLSTIYFAARQEYNKRLEKEKEA